MQKIEQNETGGRFAHFGAKVSACLLSAGVFWATHLGFTGLVGVGMGFSSQAYAQNCTGTQFACATYTSSWNIVPGRAAQTKFTNASFRFPEPITYPARSSPVVKQAGYAVYVTVPFGGGLSAAQNSAYFELRPTSELISVGGGRYKIRGITEDLTISFEASFDGSTWTQVNGNTPVKFDGITSRSSFNAYLQVRMVAYLAAPQAQNINIPTKTIFTMHGPDGAKTRMGDVIIEGSPAIEIVVPKPKTCDPYNGGDKTFNLGRIEVHRLNNNANTGGATETVNLTNCPANISLRLSLTDVNDANASRNYLRSTGTAANAGVQLFYNNSTTPLTMKSTWNVTTTAGGNSFPFTAKFYHITSQGNLGVGTVVSAATLRVEYP